MARKIDYLAGIAYASIFGLSFLVSKAALAALAPFELLFLRFALAALIMSLLIILRIVKVDFRGKKPGLLALACLFQPLLYFTGETLGLRESASSTAGLVIGALPAVATILGALMLKEGVGLVQGVFLTLSIFGVGVIALLGGTADGGTGSSAGFLLLIGAVVSAALYNVFSRRSSAIFTPVETTFAMMWTGAVGFGIATLASGGWSDLLPRALAVAPGVLYLGALSSVLAFFFINFTLSRLRVSQSIVFSNLTTVIAVVAGVLLRGERFGIPQLVGSVMIVAGVWGTNAFAARGREARTAA